MHYAELKPESIKRIMNYRKLFDVVRLSVEIDIYSHIVYPVTLKRLSTELHLDAQFVQYFLDVLHRFGFVDVVTHNDELSYVNTAMSDQYLNSNSATYLGKELFDNVDIGTNLQTFVARGPKDIEITQAYWSRDIEQQIASISLLGGVQATVEAVDLSGRQRLLDVGGGHGLYSILFTQKYPGLKAWVLDFPHVIEITKEFIHKLRARDKVRTIAGDYHDFKPRRRFDVVFASNVTSSYDEVSILLAKSYEFLINGGLLILRSFTTDVDTDKWSSLIVLERYTRRGHKGLASQQFECALESNNFADVRRVFAGDGITILQAVKR